MITRTGLNETDALEWEPHNQQLVAAVASH